MELLCHTPEATWRLAHLPDPSMGEHRDQGSTSHIRMSLNQGLVKLVESYGRVTTYSGPDQWRPWIHG